VETCSLLPGTSEPSAQSESLQAASCPTVPCPSRSMVPGEWELGEYKVVPEGRIFTWLKAENSGSGLRGLRICQDTCLSAGMLDHSLYVCSGPGV
jgi:hypothetical protein